MMNREMKEKKYKMFFTAGSVLYGAGEYSKAYEAYRKAERIFPDRYEVQNNQLDLLVNHYKDIDNICSKVMRLSAKRLLLNPENVELYRLYNNYSYRFEIKAFSFYKTLMAKYPGNISVINGFITRCILCCDMKEGERRRISEKNICNIIQNNAGLYIQLTRVFLDCRGDHECPFNEFDLTIFLKRVIKYDACNAEAYLLLGILLDEKDVLDEAISIFNKYYELSGDSFVFCLLGNLYSKKEEYNEAIKCYNLFTYKGIEKIHDVYNPHCRYQFSLAYYNIGKMENEKYCVGQLESAKLYFKKYSNKFIRV